MKKKNSEISKNIKNIFSVYASNLLSAICGVATCFVLPKILAVEDYGYYKTFTLYSSYLGIFGFGIIDGIYLKYGGKDYADLDKKQIRLFFRSFLLIALMVSTTVFLTSLYVISKHTDILWIIFFLCLNLCFVNTTEFFQQISQITQRFREYSIRKIIQSVLIIISMISLSVMYFFNIHISFKNVITIFVFINLGLALWYTYTYFDIIAGKCSFSLRSFYKTVIMSKIGLPLLLSNLSAIFIMSLDRQFVSIFFTIKEYAIYSFAYNLLSLFFIFSTSLSIVFYPILKRINIGTMKRKYSLYNFVVLTVMFLSGVIFFPLRSFLYFFLPKYSTSIDYFRILLPAILFSATLSIVTHNYYKCLGFNNTYFKLSIFILVLSASLDFLSIIIFPSMKIISIFTVVSFLLWYSIANHIISRSCHVYFWRNILFISFISSAFYCLSHFNNIAICSLTYLLMVVLASLIFYKRYLCLFVRLFTRSFRLRFCN